MVDVTVLTEAAGVEVTVRTEATVLVLVVVVEELPPPPATAPMTKPIAPPANHFQFRRHHDGFFGEASEGSLVGSSGPTAIGNRSRSDGP